LNGDPQHAGVAAATNIDRAHSSGGDDELLPKKIAVDRVIEVDEA
jgi:hypothetical protein